MRKTAFCLSLLFMAGILVINAIPAQATSPCWIDDVSDIWMYNDHIYTGKVVSISNITDYAKNDSIGDELQNDIRIHFELDYMLKGNPTTSWYRDVPLKSTCRGDFCVSGADFFLVGMEIFRKGFGFHGACGEMFTQGPTGQALFKYFEDMYGFSPPKSTHISGEKIKCNNYGYLLVLRDNGKRACVTENTSEKMKWHEIKNTAIEFQNNTNVNVTYDYPLSSKTTQTKNYDSSPDSQSDVEITLSNLPKIGENATITAIFTDLEQDYTLYGLLVSLGRQLTAIFTDLEQDYTPTDQYFIAFYITDNFRFVDIDKKDIEQTGFSKSYKKSPIVMDQNHENTFPVTIKAVSEGYGSILIQGSDFSHKFIVHVDKDQTLLVEDYFRNYYPVTNVNLHDDKDDKIMEKPIKPTEIERIHLVSCKDEVLFDSGKIYSKEKLAGPCDGIKTFEYGYKIISGNDTGKTNDYDVMKAGDLRQTAMKELETLGKLDHIMDSYDVKIYKLPTLYEAGQMAVSFTTIEDDYSEFDFTSNPYMFVEITTNMNFTGVPDYHIQEPSVTRKQFAYDDHFSSTLYLGTDQKHTLFVPIQALYTGVAAKISVFVGPFSDFKNDQYERTVTFTIVVEEDETLLLDDYFTKYLK